MSQERVQETVPQAPPGLVLTVTTLASFLTPYMSASVNVALPAMGAEMGMDTVALAWVPLIFLLSSAVSLVPSGRIADLFGMRRIFFLGILVYTLASFGCMAAWSPASLIALRAIQGVGGAMMFGTSIPILTSAYPPAERGRVLGINVAAVYLGLSLGPFLGGVLTQSFGWRSLFLVSAVLGLFITVTVAVRLRESGVERAKNAFDVSGAVIYAFSLIFMMYGLSLLPSVPGMLCAIAGTLSLGVFVWWESRSESPLLDVRLFRGNATFAFSNLAALINYCATFAVTFLLSLYLQYTRSMDPRETGIVLVAQPIVMTLVSPLAGRASDRVDPRIIASVGMGLSAAGLGVMAFLNETTPIAMIIGCLLLVGTGFGLFSSPNTNAVMGSVERRHLGIASATLGTMRLVGQMLSMGIAMVILAMHVGKARLSAGSHAGLMEAIHIALLVFALLCVGGVFASLARGKRVLL